jgi:hypothetical protein
VTSFACIVILLNNEFYLEQLKPVMAEWSYLWLQKQHLYGIERSEAIQYMLEGAAARTDNTVKNQCIEVALKKSQIDAGILGPDVTPTRAYQRMATNTPSAAAGRRMSFGVLNNPISATPTSAGGNGAVSNGFAVSPANQSASSMVLPAMTPLLAAEIRQLELAKISSALHRDLVQIQEKYVFFVLMFLMNSK